MSSSIDFIKNNVDFVQRAFKMANKDLNDEQLHFVPQGQSHSVAWVMWHAARIQDLFLNTLFQGKPQEWDAGGWAAKTGLPEKGFGTGMSNEDAANVRIKDLDAFHQYARKIDADMQAFFDTLTEADLGREVKLGERIETLGESINLHLVTHLNGHRGEINLIRGMLGFEPVLPNQGG